MTKDDRITMLTDALHAALNLETAAKLGAEVPSMAGLDVPHHFRKIRAALLAAGHDVETVTAWEHEGSNVPTAGRLFLSTEERSNAPGATLDEIHDANRDDHPWGLYAALAELERGAVYTFAGGAGGITTWIRIY